MFIKCWMLGTVLFYVCIFTSNAWRPYDIKLTNLSFHSPNNLVSVNFTLTDSVINAWIDLTETVQKPYVHVEVYLDLGNGKYELEFMNRTIDGCRLLRDKKYEALIQIVYKSILPHCNCPIRCPIQKKLYYVKNFSFNTENFPPIFPERKAFFQAKFLRKICQKMELLGTLSVVAIVEKTYKTNG